MTEAAEVLTVIYELDGDIYLQGEGWSQSTGLHFDADGGEWEERVAEMLRSQLGLVVVGDWTESQAPDYTATATVRTVHEEGEQPS